MTILCFISFIPPIPQSNLDASWVYALDYGSSHHWSFGRTLLFTFGPLVSLYTDFRVPEHDKFYFIFDSILASGIFSGFLIAAHTRRRAFLLLLPLFLANLLMKDAILFMVPLTLVMGACRRQMAGRVWEVAFGLVAIADGLLPLTKGSTLVPVVCCTVLSCAALLRDRSPWAIIAPTLTAASAMIAWLVSGQAFSDVPPYLLNQFQMASGYTDAMAISGKTAELAMFVLLGLALAGLFFGVEHRHRVIRVLAILCIEFLAFKAGFVRHDGHAFIAGSCLGFLGFLLLLHDPTRRAYFGLLCGLVGCFVIAGAYFPLDAPSLLSRLTSKVTDSSAAIAMRFAHPKRTFLPFARAKDAIRSQAHLPHIDGAVDIYPVNVAALLAADLEWDPRPSLQSYSAYVPDLIAMNARHLTGKDAPANVLFAIGPIDDRFPSLEDGASWPELLSHYEFSSFADPYALLKRSDVDHHAAIGAPVTGGSFLFDEDIPVPAGVRNVWASIRFHPPQTSRLFSIAFKLPILTLRVTFASGERQSFRMIPGMAEGFLLSPVILSARDFVALSAADEERLASKQVRSFSIHQDSKFPFWGRHFDVSLSPLTFERHQEADNQLFGNLVEGGPPKLTPVGGECSIDLLDDKHPGSGELNITTGNVRVQGWGVISSSKKVQSGALEVVITGDDGSTFYSKAVRTPRPDVERFFGMPDDAEIGFSSLIDLRALHGSYKLHVVQQGPDGLLACPADPVAIAH